MLIPWREVSPWCFRTTRSIPIWASRQNIGFPLNMQGVDKKTIQQRVNEAAEVLQLQELLERKPAQLSGGQRQRVAIGRAIVRNPDVFLFDEPLSNLDAELRVSMRVEIAKLHKTLGTTMIYVTHDQTEAMTLADKIVVLRAGRIEQVGTPEELYTDPATLFVAGFIGSPRMNFLNGKYADGKVTLVNGVSWTVAPLADRPIDILVGVRPEHFVPGSTAVSLPLTVDIVEYLGGTRLYLCDIRRRAANYYRRSGRLCYAVGRGTRFPSRRFQGAVLQSGRAASSRRRMTRFYCPHHAASVPSPSP